jgi:hypothetical protein
VSDAAVDTLVQGAVLITFLVLFYLAFFRN